MKPSPGQEVALDLLKTMQRRVLYHGAGAKISQEVLITGLAEFLGDLISMTPVTSQQAILRIVLKTVAKQCRVKLLHIEEVPLS